MRSAQLSQFNIPHYNLWRVDHVTRWPAPTVPHRVLLKRAPTDIYTSPKDDDVVNTQLLSLQQGSLRAHRLYVDIHGTGERSSAHADEAYLTTETILLNTRTVMIQVMNRKYT